MGFLFAGLFAALAILALHMTGRCTREALELAGAAMLLGIAGYAWQGSPSIPGHPVAHSAAAG